MKSISFLMGLIFLSFGAYADDFQAGKAAILKMQGCYLVDYSYSETEALKPGYKLDSRVYDVNKDKSVKEWIYPIQVSDTKIRMQHILFFTDLNGKVNPDAFLKHEAEDWEFQPAAYYQFTQTSHWEPKAVSLPGAWVRKITNLDDGLRYQCESAWKTTGEYPEWTCSTYAPIPGREYRDMGRKDYQTMARTTRLIMYGTNWLERQNNIKTIHTATERTPLAREVGKNWYIQLPASECNAAVDFATPRMAYWNLLRQTWDEVLTAKENFVEKTPQGKGPRYFEMLKIEDKYFDKVGADATMKNKARQEILDVISAYRLK